MRNAHIVILTANNIPLPYNMDRITELVHVTVSDAQSLPTSLPSADGVLMWDFSSDALEQTWSVAGNVQWVHVAAAGVEAVMFEGLRNSPAILTNARGVFDEPIAEFVLASILAHDKQIHTSKCLQQQGIWKHRELRRTSRTNALVVGTGGIGRATARLLAAIGMNVKGAGRRAVPYDGDFGVVVPSAELAAHAGWADHLVLAVPLTPETVGLLGEGVLAAMKEDAHIINVSRGAIIDEQALLVAMQERRLGHASLDVFIEEPLPAEHPFWAADTITISAHMSGDVAGWRDALADQYLHHLELFTADQPFRQQVDKERGYVAGA